QAADLGAGRVEITITNTGAAAQSLPLLVHSALDTFPTTVDGKALAAPTPDWPNGFGFDTARMLVKIVLPPAGVARATLRIDPTFVSREAHACPPEAKCAPDVVQSGTLPPGVHTLKIRTPLYSIRSELEATLAFTLKN